MPEPDQGAGSPLSKMIWFVGLWLCGVAIVGTIAFMIRSVLL